MIVSLLLVPFIAASVTQDRTASPYVTASPIVSPIVVRYVAGLTFRRSPRRLLAYVALALKDKSVIRCVAPIFSGRCWDLLDNIQSPEPFDQTWALPPSTNSSIPVTKLESSDARNNATFATSSGSPMRPIGMVDTIRAITSADCRLTSGVLIGPGLTTFERIRRSFRSVVQVRANDRSAALLAA